MKNGFSLVELSIVLVILGLLVGGIMTGQNLIKAAEMRSVTTEFQQYQTAVNLFKEKYLAIPGDMRNAEDFWGTADPVDATCRTTAAVGTETCNGNGDGLIGFSTARSFETYRVWQQLMNAGLVQGAYTGVPGAAGAPWDADVGGNIPKSKFGNVGWSLVFYTTGVFANMLNVPTTNFFIFGKEAAGANSHNWHPSISPEDAWNIDTKIDDGRPGRGVVQTFNNTRDPDCADSDVASTAVYQVTNVDIGCTLLFLNPF